MGSKMSRETRRELLILKKAHQHDIKTLTVKLNKTQKPYYKQLFKKWIRQDKTQIKKINSALGYKRRKTKKRSWLKYR